MGPSFKCFSSKGDQPNIKLANFKFQKIENGTLVFGIWGMCSNRWKGVFYFLTSTWWRFCLKHHV